MEIKEIDGIWRPRASIKRWWRADWKGFFQEFLNIDGVDRSCLPSLMGWRQKLLDTFETEGMRPILDRAVKMLNRKTKCNRRMTL